MTDPANANAVAEYLSAGGCVKKGEETVPVTTQEIVAYLATRGVKARFCPGDRRPYLLDRKRVSARRLLDIANQFRREDDLTAFALKLDPLDPRARRLEGE